MQWQTQITLTHGYIEEKQSGLCQHLLSGFLHSSFGAYKNVINAIRPEPFEVPQPWGMDRNRHWEWLFQYIPPKLPQARFNLCSVCSIKLRKCWTWPLGLNLQMVLKVNTMHLVLVQNQQVVQSGHCTVYVKNTHVHMCVHPWKECHYHL